MYRDSLAGVAFPCISRAQRALSNHRRVDATKLSTSKNLLGVFIISCGKCSCKSDNPNEFTDMIITQRGFQGNSKIITVSDEMLETLINMKR